MFTISARSTAELAHVGEFHRCIVVLEHGRHQLNQVAEPWEESHVMDEITDP